MKTKRLGVPSAQEAEAGGSRIQGQGQSRLIQTLSPEAETKTSHTAVIQSSCVCMVATERQNDRKVTDPVTLGSYSPPHAGCPAGLELPM